MGKISEQLINLLKKQIAAHGLVVWYDPDQSYAGLANSLALWHQDRYIPLQWTMPARLDYIVLKLGCHLGPEN
jgi:hypothetical protein